MKLSEFAEALIKGKTSGTIPYLWPCATCGHVVLFDIHENTRYVECPSCEHAQLVKRDG